MSIWNKVLLGLTTVVALVFCYMSMRTLKTHQYWRELARDLGTRTVATAKESELLERGLSDPENQEDAKVLRGSLNAMYATDPPKDLLGIDQYRRQINHLVEFRGRVWRKCTPANADAETGKVSVTVEQPVPHKIDLKGNLFVFDETEKAKKGSYIGQFTVEAVEENGNKVGLAPLQPMNQRELDRLKGSRGPWVMYEKMPADSRTIFADLTEEEKKVLFPEDTLAEFVHDGENATWEKIEEWKVPGTLVDGAGKPLLDEKGEKIAGAKGTYQRELRDYYTIVNNRNLERTIMSYVFALIEEETNRLQAASDEAKLQIAARKTEIAFLGTEKIKLCKERDALAAHAAALTRNIANIRAQVDQMLAANKTMAAQIAKAQLDAAQRIDARSPAMAQSADGTN